jgi:ABC-type siderophore export system fused ATPase/permease subunit
MKYEKVFLGGLMIVAAALALKSIKQLIYLSFTLLSLKVVWIVLIILFVLSSLKKRAQPSREIKK